MSEMTSNNKRTRPFEPPMLKGNELLARWEINQTSLPPDFHSLLSPDISESRRGDLFELEDEEAQEKYAWAIPNEKALMAISEFAPIIEMGAGAGYWARLLRDRGVEIEAYDCDVGENTQAAGVMSPPWTVVNQGGPEVLVDAFEDSALLMIYPDDLTFGGAKVQEASQEQSLSLSSLLNYTGDTVIHVGELLGDTKVLSMEGQEDADTPYAWGRSTNPEFQMVLQASFHKVLQLPLPNWGVASNCLTIWKRTTTTVLEGDRYGYVPPQEQLNLAMACPSTAHLL